jgi:hypothetical protein
VTLVRWGAPVALAISVTVITSWYAGAVTSAAVFLGFVVLAFGWVTNLMERTVRALLKEPPPEAVAIATGRRKKELEREKMALLKALKELEFDHEMGKVSDADFKELSANYRTRAVRVMRQLEIDAAGADYHDLVERDLTMKRGGPREEAAGEEKDEKEEVPGKRVCVCGVVNDTDAEFCKKCGKKLDAAEATG